MSRFLTSLQIIAVMLVIAMVSAPLGVAEAARASAMTNSSMDHSMMTSSGAGLEMADQSSDCETHCADLAADVTCPSDCMQVGGSMTAVLNPAVSFKHIAVDQYDTINRASVLDKHKAFDPPPPRI